MTRAHLAGLSVYGVSAMSNYRGNAEQCPHCRVTYKRFRSGLTYQDVWSMLADNSPDPADWRYKRRRTILGAWHQFKRELWQRHKDAECPLWAPF